MQFLNFWAEILILQKMNKTKAYRTFNGVKYTLYCSGSKTRVDDYLKEYGVPKKALYRKIKIGNEYRLYLYFRK